MRTLIVGMGVQGLKRKKFCKNDFVGFVDPFNPKADFKSLNNVPTDIYDAVLACIPDKPKEDLIKYCILNSKHMLIEKPIILSSKKFDSITNLINQKKIICYPAYNHRFEPHFLDMKTLLDSKKLGKIYSCRMFYGNGTARLVKESPWRDKGSGVLADLGSHLLDTCYYWFNSDFKKQDWEIISTNRFENKSPDHCVITNNSKNFRIELEMTMLMWKNYFSCDILAENGTAHIESLCKWGPTTFIHRKRVLPSGRPTEFQKTIVSDDPTWEIEYNHFKKLIKEKKILNFNWQKSMNKILLDLENRIK
ncbi:Gfo/Idh/MocA family oxidoreductase [bacterium]|nr:Gfo/Idh/MocA family oxidoreductase [bacterium]